MRCVTCQVGETTPGVTTLTIERDSSTLVLKGVPAEVCEACGEAFIDEDVLRRVEDIVAEAIESGVQVEVREYRVAC